MLLSPSTLLRLLAVLYVLCPVLHVVPALGCSTKARNKKLRLRFVPSASELLRQPGAWRAHSPWVHSPRVRGTFSPPHPQPQSPPALVGCLRPVSRCNPPRQMSTIQNLRRSLIRNWRPLIRNWRPVCRAVWAVVLGAEPAPFPSRLPPASAGLGRSCELFSGLARSLAVCSGRLIFSLSFAVPQFKLVTQKLPPIVLRALRPGPYPEQFCWLLSVLPPLAGGGCGHLGYFSAGSCF